MKEKNQFKENFDRSIKEFEENGGDLAKFAAEETSANSLHKLLKKEDFILPKAVLEELSELERADLIDLKKELWS